MALGEAFLIEPDEKAPVPLLGKPLANTQHGHGGPFGTGRCGNARSSNLAAAAWGSSEGPVSSRPFLFIRRRNPIRDLIVTI